MTTSTPERRFPAEWENHAATLVAWPGRASVWQSHLEQGRAETLAMIQAIAETESVVVAADPLQVDAVTRLLEDDPRVVVAAVALDDSWARDISPLFVLTKDLGTVAVDFTFNAWGGKFIPHTSDAAFGDVISRALRVERETVDLTLEGGSITTDGHGTALIVEKTVLNPNRNPTATRDSVEAALRVTLGIQTVIWLPYGLLEDTDTDGHVDNVAVFIAPSTVLAQAPPHRSHPDADRLAANLAILRSARTAQGAQLDVVEVPWLVPTPLDDSRPSSYVNVYPLNEQILVPVVGCPADDWALDLVATLFPGRRTTAVASSALAFGGGGPHCMTMQLPSPQPDGKELTT